MRNHFSAKLLVSTIKTRARKTSARINGKCDKRKKNDDHEDEDDSTGNFLAKIKFKISIATHTIFKGTFDL